jgi:GNAT superfamily N-acetyltransferase
MERNPISLVLVSSPTELAQAALLLGEQRAWIESMLGHDIAEMTPAARREYAYLAESYAYPGQLVVARYEGEPVGVVALAPRRDGRVELKRLFVRESARAFGVGRELMRGALALAWARGFARVFLETSPARMPRAYDYYRRLGFVDAEPDGLAGRDGVVGMEYSLPRVPQVA